MYLSSEFNNSSSMCVKIVSLTSRIHVLFMYIHRGHLLYMKFSIFFNEETAEKYIKFKYYTVPFNSICTPCDL
jgi:hypothetical protein